MLHAPLDGCFSIFSESDRVRARRSMQMAFQHFSRSVVCIALETALWMGVWASSCTRIQSDKGNYGSVNDRISTQFFMDKIALPTCCTVLYVAIQRSVAHGSRIRTSE
jgi:hypothetical protein